MLIFNPDYFKEFFFYFIATIYILEPYHTEITHDLEKLVLVFLISIVAIFGIVSYSKYSETFSGCFYIITFVLCNIVTTLDIS